jgi:Kef-type K+ transport system membrane component KefB/voltage-gated potassium channel Kch
MAVPVNIETYREALIVLAAAGLVIPLFQRFKISAVPGFLLMGFLLGPGMLGQLGEAWPWTASLVLGQEGSLPQIAELGVVFLLFMVGLELSLERLMALRRLVFGFGSAQLLISALVLGVITFALGASPLAAALMGLALALSSTAIVIQLLADQKRMGSQTGRASFAVLLLQDISVVPILLFAGIALSEGGSVLSNVMLALGKAALALGTVVLVGRMALRPLLRMVAGTRSTDFFMAATLLIVMGTGLLAGFGGLSMALGAFIAGLLLAETEFRREIETVIEPFKGLLLGTFFMVVGSGLDPAVFLQNPLILVALTLGLIAVKALVIIAIAPLFRVPRPAAVASALLLGPGGEFAFVVLAAAVAAGNMDSNLEETALIVVSLSMMLIPLLSRLGVMLKARIGPQEGLPEEALAEPEVGLKGHVIITGFGRVGQIVADVLEERGMSYIAVDQDAALVARHRKRGRPVYYGSSDRADFLKHCGIDDALAMAITMNSASVDRVIAAARSLRPDLRIVARARDERHAAQLYVDGVTEAVPETTEASLQLGEAVLLAADVPMGLAIATIHEQREKRRKRLGQSDRSTQLRLKRQRTLRDMREKPAED